MKTKFIYMLENNLIYVQYTICALSDWLYDSFCEFFLFKYIYIDLSATNLFELQKY